MPSSNTVVSALRTIRLPKGEWSYDENGPLGSPGGFGAVFSGTHPFLGTIAVKKLHISAAEAAHRELAIADELVDRTFSNVIPTYDAGQDAESGEYFIVMARGDHSLADAISKVGKFDDGATAKILLAIASGLSEVQHIVHRDLKPQNILLHNGAWKVADFGIARFVETATSANTLKGFLTPPYAAPEQWQLESATNATDVYSLGCIAYALLTGVPPFQQGDKAALCQMHLQMAPPALPDSVNPQLRSLVGMMLRKAQDSRPSLRRIRDLLDSGKTGQASVARSKGFDLLSEASAALESERAAFEAEKQLTISKAERRKRLQGEAKSLAIESFDALSLLISRQAPNARVQKMGHSEADTVVVDLGNGRLTMQVFSAEIPENAFPQSKWDVAAHGQMFVFQEKPRYEWSSSLWYAKLPNTENFRWYEVAYCNHPLLSERQQYEPRAMRDYNLADAAASSLMQPVMIAFGPTAVDDENVQSFYDRWAALLAKASRGEITYPRELPLKADFI
jgi:serine/threonine protein kinase